MDFSALNSVDYIVLTIVAVSVLFGFVKGFIRSILSLVGWLAAGYIAYHVFPLVKPILLTHFSSEIAVNVGGPVVVYFAALILLSLISYQITVMLGGICGGMVDRSLGFAFGFARGALIVTIAFMGLTMLAPGMSNDKMQSTYQQQTVEAEKVAPEWLRKAQTYRLLKIGEGIMLSAFSPEFLNQIQQLAGWNKKLGPSQASVLQATKVVEQMQQLLPKGQLGTVDVNAMDAMPPKEADNKRKELFRIVLEAYKSSVKSGKIPAGGITEEDIKQLEGVINAPYVEVGTAKAPQQNKAGAPGAGYDKKQINEFDRLIQTVQ